MKIIILVGIAIMLSSCFGQDVKNQKNPIKVFKTGTIEDICAGKTIKNESTDKYINVGLLSTEFGIGTSKEKAYTTITKSDLKTDNANLKVMQAYHKCITQLLSGDENDLLRGKSAYDRSPIDKLHVTIDGEPEVMKDTSWFFNWHYDDWILKYAVTALNRSSYPVSCSYKISSCPFSKNSCISLYELYIKEFELKSGDKKEIRGGFEFEYGNDKKPPVETKLSCPPLKLNYFSLLVNNVGKGTTTLLKQGNKGHHLLKQ